MNDADGRPVGEAVSGPDGQYRIPDLTAGEYTVVTSLFEPALRQVELGAGESVTVDLDLATRTREDAQP
nr:carboxypeptidase-like regulatory domain-containing protein [Amycolatopsis taiwanensis]